MLLEPKIYPNEDVLDGGFWGFRAEYMSFNSLTPKPITGEYTNGSSSILFSSTEKLPVSRTNIDLAIMKGYVFPLQKLLINIELGAGARFAAVNGYDTGVRQTAAGNPEFAIRNNFTETAVMPLFLGAVKLGYAF